jgi:hypothetical protein
LPKPQTSNPLCQLLAAIREPLLIVSASQDTLLENAFAAAKKRCLVVSSVVTPMPDFHPGQILLRYSDREQPEEARLGEDLSRLSPLENGYSVVFKIRGECPSPQALGPRDLSSLVLTERSLFAFARHVDKLIPSYLSRHLATRGFWFLGFEPRHWEDRLVAGSILEARRSLEPASVVGREAVGFEATYWSSRGVRRFPVDLPDFVTRLGGAP